MFSLLLEKKTIKLTKETKYWVEITNTLGSTDDYQYLKKNEQDSDEILQDVESSNSSSAKYVWHENRMDEDKTNGMRQK